MTKFERAQREANDAAYKTLGAVMVDASNKEMERLIKEEEAKHDTFMRIAREEIKKRDQLREL